MSGTKPTPGPWKPGLPPGKFYPEMANDYEVYFSPGGMKWHRRIRAALAKALEPDPPPMDVKMDEAQIKHMVDRFLGWRLPEKFAPDGGVSFEKFGNKGTPHQYSHQPTGTNLLDAIQAAAMVRYMLEGLPSVSSADVKQEKRDAAERRRVQPQVDKARRRSAARGERPPSVSGALVSPGRRSMSDGTA